MTLSVRVDFMAAPDHQVYWKVNQYQVREIRTPGATERVWVGRSSDDHLTAFFEVEQGGDFEADLSHVVRLTAAQVSNERGEAANAVQVQCLDPRLNEVFISYVDDVIAHMASGEDAVYSLRATATEWRSLLAVAKEGLSETSLRGLFGELSFLRNLIIHTGAQGLDVWTGADRERHDFVSMNASVEIKTSSLQNRQAVTVHGLRQLDPPEGADLTLGVLEIEKHPQGTSVGDVVVEILALGADAAQLRQKLARCGFVQGMPGAGEHLYKEVCWKFWEVTAELPVLRRSVLPEKVVNAVSDLRYSLDLAALGTDFSGTYEYTRLAMVKS